MKPKRDITLGEMQDECIKRMHTCAPDVDGNNECRYFDTCKQMLARCCIPPENWNLTDPPRFTDAQMALLKALYDVGVLELVEDCEYEQVIIYTCNGRVGGFKNKCGIELPLRLGETLDLAELFGKE